MKPDTRSNKKFNKILILRTQLSVSFVNLFVWIVRMRLEMMSVILNVRAAQGAASAPDERERLINSGRSPSKLRQN